MKQNGLFKVLILIFMFFLFVTGCKKQTAPSPASVISGISLDFRAPYPSQFVKGKIGVAVHAQDNSLITKVELYLDGVLKLTDTDGVSMGDFGTIYAFALDVSSQSAGQHTLMAKAYDDSNNVESKSINIEVVSSSYTLSMTSPAVDNLEYDPATESPVLITGTFSGSPEIGLKIDGLPFPVAQSGSSFSFSWDISLEREQERVIEITAVNSSNIKDTLSITRIVKIKDLISPIINLFDPGLGSIKNSTFDVYANVLDNIGVSEVTLFTQKVGSGTWVQHNTDTTSPFSWTVPVTSDTQNGEYYIKMVAKDASGNTGTFDSSLLTAPNTIRIAYPKTYAVISGDEGSLLSADGLNGSGADSSSLMIGNHSGKRYKGILSFDTSSLAGKTITRAYLTLKAGSLSGTPFSSNLLYADIKTGFFGSASTLESADWIDSYTYENIASFASFSSGSQSSSDFNSDGLSSINTTGKTQFRLHFGVDPIGSEDYLSLALSQSVLIIEFY